MKRLATVSAFLLLVSAPAFAAPGDVDASYGTGGTATIPDTGGPHWLGDIAVRPGGAVVVVGSEIGAGSGEQALWAAEIAPDGSSFADLSTGVLGFPYEFASAVALDTDGVAALTGGYGALGGDDPRMLVGKLLADGSPDATFADSSGLPAGFIRSGADNTAFGSGIVVEGDEIVAGGWRDALDHRTMDAATYAGDATLQHAFIELWTVGGTTYEAVDVHAFPGADTDTIVVGAANAATTTSAAAFRVESDSGEAPDVTALFTGPGEITDVDATRARDGDILLGYVRHTSDGSDWLHLHRVDSDGDLVATAPVTALDEVDPDIAVAEMRTGEMAYVVTDAATQTYDVGAVPGDLSAIPDSETGTLDDASGDGHAYALGVDPVDGSLYVAAVTNPFEERSGVIEVTRFEGDASGRFVDDDDSVHETDIESIAESGITTGCNPPVNDLYCPDDPVTRAQMASFLVRAAEIPAATVASPFTDIAGSVHVADIHALWEAEVTLGCNPPDNDLYCPDDAVTRAQMASFLVRAFELADMVTPTDPDPFGDDDGSVHEADISILAEAGITLGCNPPDNDLYCPDDPVTRAQMASFLARTLLFVA